MSNKAKPVKWNTIPYISPDYQLISTTLSLIDSSAYQSKQTVFCFAMTTRKVYATTTHQLMRKLVYSKTRNNFWQQKNRFWHWPSMLKSPLKGVHPKESFSLLLPVFIYKHWTVVAVAHISVSYLINTVKFCSKVGIIMIIIMLWFDWFQSPSNLYSLFMYPTTSIKYRRC